MTEMNGYDDGVFCWTDLVAHDFEAAKAWYSKIFGWTAVDQDTKGGPPYVIWTQDGRPVAGLGQMSEEMKASGAPTMWTDYVAVSDVEATAAKAAELGGKVIFPPFQVLDSGSMAAFMDPHGAMFAVWKAGTHFGAGTVNVPNSMSWNELATTDVPGARKFYGELFGWTYSEQDMGQFVYTSIAAGRRSNGGIVPMVGEQWQGIPPHWMTYFSVADVDATAKAIEEAGGKICVPAIDIPQVGRFAVVNDAQGATFTIITMLEVRLFVD
ncbi:VOC family protein [Plesiocystis pacifica]|uniref:VOC family protein n=1 Tax=Plesiocystis pacifica TaxID=191768 RepID=UPI0005D47F5B|nr:VOC family protein [Plesiocystis pacifica]